MHDTFGYNEALLRLKINRTVLKINDEMSLENEEELVIVIVLVPMVLTLHDTQTNNRIVHLAERLVVPLIRASRNERRDINEAKLWELDIKVRGVWVGLGVTHPGLLRQSLLERSLNLKLMVYNRFKA
jgi:hypothetical protein